VVTHDPLCPNTLRPLAEGDTCNYCALIATVRADERAKHPGIPAVTRATMDVAMPLILGALRAKVEALRYTESGGYGNAINDVLALLDGGSDE